MLGVFCLGAGGSYPSIPDQLCGGRIGGEWEREGLGGGGGGVYVLAFSKDTSRTKKKKKKGGGYPPSADGSNKGHN